MMNEMARKHIETMGRHGAYVLTAGGKRVLSGAFYDSIVRFCLKYGINCISYDMRIPETEEPLMLAIWRNGHVDSGSAEHIRAVMEQ